MPNSIRSPMPRFSSFFCILVTASMALLNPPPPSWPRSLSQRYCTTVYGYDAFLIAAHLFFCAAAMRFRAAALIVRFGFFVAGLADCGAETCLIFAHLAFCAKAILRLTAALRFFRGFRISDGGAVDSIFMTRIVGHDFEMI